VLERVTVLGVGEGTQSQQASGDGDQTIPAALVTLAVTQAQAEVLVHSVQTGSLYFALLRDGTVTSAPRSVTDQLLFGSK
jgi:Flp pilus assembly protein CpaB